MTPLIWSTQNGTETAQGYGINYYIYKHPHKIRWEGCDYALRIEFNSTGAWIRSDEVLDSVGNPTICKEQAEKIAAAISGIVCAEVEKARPKWIPVGERLPEERIRVNALDSTGDVEYCYYGLHSFLNRHKEGRQWWYAQTERKVQYPITHWQPLPAPSEVGV